MTRTKKERERGAAVIVAIIWIGGIIGGLWLCNSQEVQAQATAPKPVIVSVSPERQMTDPTGTDGSVKKLKGFTGLAGRKSGDKLVRLIPASGEDPHLYIMVEVN